MTYLAPNTINRASSTGSAQALRENTPAASLLPFLAERYEGEGWACLGFIDGDPSIRQGQPGYAPMVQEWYAWPRQARVLAQRFSELAARGLNLYLGQCLFRTRTRSYATALPSRWLWVDDAQADTPCTELVQSSAQSYQAWLQLDTLLPADERQQLQRRWRQVLGGDTCSANAVGMARAPIGYNTKRHGRFAVRRVGGSGARCQLATFIANLPPVVAARTSSSGSVTTADWAQLPSGAGLARSARFKRACANRPQLRTIVLEGGRVALPGKADDSGSTQVAIFINNLLHLYKPYPEREIRALALHYAEMLRPGVDLAHFQADVDRLIVRYRPTNYQPQATRYVPGAGSASGAKASDEINVCTHQEAKKPGRPAGRSATHRAMLLSLLVATSADAFGRVPADTAALADTLQLTRRRVLQLLASLTESGEIHSFIPGTRWRSAYVLLSSPLECDVVTHKEPEAYDNQVKLNAAGPHAAEVPDCQTQRGETAHETGDTLERTCSGVYSLSTAPISPEHATDVQPAPALPAAPVAPQTPPAPQSLRAAIGEAFDAAGPGVRITRQRVERYLAANFPDLRYGPGALAGELAAEREERRRRVRLAGIAETPKRVLKAELRLAENRAERSRQQGTNAYRWWEFYAACLQQELRRRPAEPTKPRCGVLEVLPNPREAAQARQTAQQTDLWEALDRDRQHAPLPSRLPVATHLVENQPLHTEAAVSSCTTNTAICPTSTESPFGACSPNSAAWSLIDRLRARKQVLSA